LSEQKIDSDDAEATAGPLSLPLDSWHRARGARMVEFAGYAMPVQYEGIIAEPLWTRESAGLFDVSHMGQLLVSSGEAEAALEALLPADLRALPMGGMRYSLLLNGQGGILDDLMITRWRQGFHIVVNGATKWDDIAHLREHFPERVTLTHRDEHCLLALQGPSAAAVLGRFEFTPALPEIAPPTALRFMQMGPYIWRGQLIGVSRSGYTGEDGFEISVRAQDAEALADALCDQPEVKPIGLGARDSLRLEAGLPLYGHDLGEDTDPVSAGLGFAISKRRRAEGGFPGAERILKLLEQGTPTRRVGLALEGRMAAREGAAVLAGGREVGRVTSGGFSPSLNRPIAMAYVEAGSAAPGAALDVENRGRRLAATVAPMPFVPHRYHR
jgi:aminomethyltransferase